MYKEVDSYRQFTKLAEIHKSVNSLIGIIEGIKLDNVLNESEIEEILNWCNLQRPFSNRFPYNEIIALIDESLEDGILTSEELEDILWLCKNIADPANGFKEYYDDITSSIQQLQGLIHGIMADNSITEDEVKSLLSWLQAHDFLKGTYPFDEIFSIVTAILEDGVISEDEKSILKAFFANFIDLRSSYNINEYEIKNLQETYSINGVCSVKPTINFENHVFSFTGTSGKATRKEIAELITANGGIFNNNVTKKTHYLIVGGEGNPCWAYSCYGRKVEKAVELRKNGQPIILVHEEDFWNKL